MSKTEQGEKRPIIKLEPANRKRSGGSAVWGKPIGNGKYIRCTREGKEPRVLGRRIIIDTVRGVNYSE